MPLFLYLTGAKAVNKSHATNHNIEQEQDELPKASFTLRGIKVNSRKSVMCPFSTVTFPQYQ